jgi:Zn finger protein HypA/HybF involved in hydrogenase expression
MNTSNDYNVVTPPTKPVGRLRRIYEAAADRLSPPLECDQCGTISKQRHYRRTGATRPLDPYASRYSQWTVSEHELICPHCHGSTWIEVVSQGQGVYM